MPPTRTPQLSIGAARVDITPPVGCDLTGFIGRLSSSLGIHDPLFARAIFMEQGKTQAILISCDLLGLEVPFIATARRAIERETGVPAQNITIACTHTHSGPASMYLRFCGDVDVGYMAHLLERLIQVAREARSTPVPATMSSGITRVSGVSVNRRVPGGPVDEELDVIRFDDEQVKPLAAITSFACHPVTYSGMNRLVSADYPGVLCQRLEKATGAVTLFLNGASAQINPCALDKPRDVAAGELDYVQLIGNKLADAALEIWSQLKSHPRSTLKVQSREVGLQLQRVDEASIEAAFTEHTTELAALLPSLSDDQTYLEAKWLLGAVESAAETRDLLRSGRVPKSIAAEVQTVQLGDLVFAAVPGEFFLEFGSQIKRALAPRRAIVATYTNGNFGYLPTRKAFVEGGYETIAYRYYGYPAAFSATAGERIVATVKSMHPPKGTKTK